MILNRKFLKFEIDLDFVLIAVTTSLKDYRICYLINKFLNFNFIKIPDLAVDIYRNESTILFSLYHYNWETTETDFYFIANKGTEGYLIPEMKEADYFLLIKNYIDENDLDTIREINEQYKTNVGILADLQGPKIRIGLVKDGGIHLVNGTRINITTHECIGDDNRIYITYETFPQDVQPNEIILLDDGKIQMKVIETNRVDTVVCEIMHGGILTSRKGVNFPNTKVSIPSLTEEDLENLK